MATVCDVAVTLGGSSASAKVNKGVVDAGSVFGLSGMAILTWCLLDKSQKKKPDEMPDEKKPDEKKLDKTNLTESQVKGKLSKPKPNTQRLKPEKQKVESSSTVRDENDVIMKAEVNSWVFNSFIFY